MALFGRTNGRNDSGSVAGGMAPMEPQSDPLANLFVELVEVSGIAPMLCGRIEPGSLYELMVDVVPFLRESSVRPSDHLAQASTPTFDIAWSIFINGDISTVVCVLTRHEGNYAAEILSLLIKPLQEAAQLKGLHTSVGSRGKADLEIVSAMRGARPVFIDELRGQTSRPSVAPERASLDIYPAELAQLATSSIVPLSHSPALTMSPPAAQSTPPSASAPAPPPPQDVRHSVPDLPESAIAQRTAATASAPVRPQAGPPRRLAKGENIVVRSAESCPETILVELGWTVRDQVASGIGIDSSAIVVGNSGRVLSNEHFVFFNNLTSPDGSVELTSGTQPAGTCTYVSTIRVRLTRMTEGAAKVVFAVTIHQGNVGRFSFADIRDSYIGLRDERGTAEIARFSMERPGDTESAMIFGEVYRHAGQWKFRAVGQGYARGLAGIAADFGVNIE